MRIALHTEHFPPKVDGVVTRLVHTLRCLASAGHEVLVLAPEGAPRHLGGARVVSLSAARLPYFDRRRVTLAGRSLRRHLDGFAPDLVHVANAAGGFFACARYCRATRVPLVVSMHTDYLAYFRAFGLGYLASALRMPIARQLRRCDLVLATSSAVQRALFDSGLARVQVWQKGVDCDGLHPSRRTAHMRARLSGGEPTAPLLVYCGRLSPEKSLERLRPLLDELPGARLALVGDGPSRAGLERLFAGLPVCFTGFLRDDELAEAMATADVHVLPSESETLGLSLLEAMASGCPVVAANAGGVGDVVHEGAGGFLFAPGDIGAMAGAVRKALAGGVELRDRARAEAERWSWPAATAQLVTLYERVVAKGAGRGLGSEAATS